MQMSEFDIVVLKKYKDYGGVGTLMTGQPGCGKTNAMARMAIIDLNNGIKVVWRAKSTCQWSVFLKENIPLTFWIKRGLRYKIINRETGREEYLSKYGKIIKWDDPNEIISNLENGVINVIQTTPINEEREEQQKLFVSDWISIMGAAIRKRYPEPISIYFDEIEDLCPESKPGYYKKSLAVAGKQKELRKNNIHFTGATHRLTEIFWVMRNKLPKKIYMHGAVTLKSSNVFKKSIDKLEPGYAFIEDREFKKIYFKFVSKPRDMFLDISLSKSIEEIIKTKEEQKWDRDKESLLSFSTRLSKEGYSEGQIAERADVTRQSINQILNEQKQNLHYP